MEEKIAVYFWELKDTLIFPIFKIISSKAYILLTSGPFIIYALIRLKKRFIIFFIAALISISASDVLCYRLLKPAIKRPRPSFNLNLSNRTSPMNKKDYSMPSNHASNMFAFFIVYLLFVERFWTVLLFNALLIGGSRIIIVKHYPSDILAGIAVGILLGLCTTYMVSFFEHKGKSNGKVSSHV